MSLTVLTAFARQDVDPWEQAASCLSQDRPNSGK